VIEDIDYTVRVSRRARRARIVVRPNMSVEVVLPAGLARAHAAIFVREKKEWVERSLKRFGEHKGQADALTSGTFPQQLHLESLGLKMPLFYRQNGCGHVRAVEKCNELHLSGCVDDADRVRAALQRWLKQKAKACLPAMLEDLARQHGYHYRKVTVRLQRSRWGSCSKSGNISLNAKLLFLPPALVRYVMLHELAHLKQMNHSAAFWAIVEQCDPGYRSHVREMRRTSCWVPYWAG